ncbi:MAG TPA: CotH kinase family protein, partial [Bacteroidales bacterium]|nr:CotH kinase family protein [Bacteroidales bacterium]
MKLNKNASGILFLLWVIALTWSVTSCEPVRVYPGDEDPDDTTAVVKDVYSVFTMDIRVADNAAVTSKDTYLKCTITVDGSSAFDDYKGSGQIRGRGNSSWLWYDKKPYRIKLDVSSGILGLKSNRDWVLLANYRDPTDLMNAFGFAVADFLDLPFVNHTRYVEVTLNGNYIGLYQLTEQVEEGNHRVNIDETNGVLICLDADDGPYYSPGAGNNFWSSVFDLPICVKYPEITTSDRLSSIQHDFALLENAINNYDYKAVDTLMDIKSFIDYLILEEFVYNVEIDAPRSVFMFKDDGGKFVMGPAWDFDAGFDFDWGTMMTGHNFFNAQELVMGTDP